MSSILDGIIERTGNIAFKCDNKTLRQDILSQLGAHLMNEYIRDDCAIEIFATNTLEDSEILRSGLLVLENEINVENIRLHAKYYKMPLDLYTIVYENYAVVQFSAKKIQVKYLRNSLEKNYHPVYIPYLFCTSVFFEISSIQGDLVIHASCVEVNNKGILFLAKKGSGKSTLSLALSLTEGYRYLSDDKIVYNPFDNKLYSIPDVIRLNKDVYNEFFLNVLTLKKQNMNTLFNDKYVFNLTYLPLNTTPFTTPSIIFLPSIRPTEEVFLRYEQIDAASLVKELLHHRIVAFENRERLINSSLSLINQCKCFSIEMGRSIEENMRNIKEIISGC